MNMRKFIVLASTFAFLGTSGAFAGSAQSSANPATPRPAISKADQSTAQPTQVKHNKGHKSAGKKAAEHIRKSVKHKHHNKARSHKKANKHQNGFNAQGHQKRGG